MNICSTVIYSIIFINVKTREHDLLYRDFFVCFDFVKLVMFIGKFITESSREFLKFEIVSRDPGLFLINSMNENACLRLCVVLKRLIYIQHIFFVLENVHTVMIDKNKLCHNLLGLKEANHISFSIMTLSSNL